MPKNRLLSRGLSSVLTEFPEQLTSRVWDNSSCVSVLLLVVVIGIIGGSVMLTAFKTTTSKNVSKNINPTRRYILSLRDESS